MERSYLDKKKMVFDSELEWMDAYTLRAKNLLMNNGLKPEKRVDYARLL